MGLREGKEALLDQENQMVHLIRIRIDPSEEITLRNPHPSLTGLAK